MTARKSMFLAMLLLLVSASPFLMASAFSPPGTTVSIQTPFTGSLGDGGSVVTGPNPQFSLSANAANNTTVSTTEYKFGLNGNPVTYNGSFTYPSNHSQSFTLYYRSNSSGGLENWKSLNVQVDATLPALQLGGPNSTLEYSKVNPSHLLISSVVDVNVSCSDGESGVQGISVTVENTTHNISSNTMGLTHSMFTNSTNQSTASVSLQCTNRVGLVTMLNLTLEEDVSPPVLTVSESGQRNGTCVEASWRLFASSQDNQSNSTVQYLDQSVWKPYPSPLSFQPGFSSVVQLRAMDAMGLVSSLSNVSVTVDDAGPHISSSLSNASLHFNASDPCGVASTYVRWHSSTGMNSGWTLASTTSLAIPSSFNGGLVRAQINSTDAVGNSNISTTPWQHTLGSLPGANLLLLSEAESGFSVPQFRLILSPSGHQSTVSWNLTRNNQSIMNGSTSSSQNIAHNFSDGDSIGLQLNISGALGQSRLEAHTWTVDGQNNASIPIYVNGSSTNVTGLVIGANSRLGHGPAADGPGGVGGDFVECTNNGTSWWESTGGLYLPQPSNSNSSAFVFGCRSVDLLGHRGPSVWSNGSIDLLGPQISHQPSTSTIIGPSTPISLLATDSSGVATVAALFTWQNSTDTQHVNLTQGGANLVVRMSQLFVTQGDGTLTLNLSATDVLGNVHHASSLQWSVNASNPFLSLNVINGSGHFIPRDSVELQILPPANWDTNLSFNYSLATSTSTLLSGTSSGAVTLTPQFSSDGFVWLNTSTTDNVGRSATQNWRLTVDGTVGTQPMFRIVNHNITVGGVLTLGPFSTIQIINAVDDSGGVGFGAALCSLDNSSYFQVNNLGVISPSGLANAVTGHELRCKNRDAFGNTGSETSLNFSLDMQPPTHSFQPSTAFISQNQTLTVLSLDNHSSVSSTLHLQWSNSTSTNNRTVSFSQSPYNFTVQNLFGDLEDGLITASLHTSDELGNSVSSQSSWFLSTHQPEPQIVVSGNVVGSFAGKGNITVRLSAVAGGTGSYTGNYTFTHSNGTILRQGNFTGETFVSMTNLSQGQLQLSATITDGFGRTQQKSRFFIIDDSNTVKPEFIVTGQNLTQQHALWLGPSTTLSLTNLSDDVNGVGFLRTECTWDGGAWFTYVLGTNVGISVQDNLESNRSLGCRNIDLLSNVGPIGYLNFTMDTVRPNVAFSPTGITSVAPSTVLHVNASDSVGIASSQLKLTWANSGQTWDTTAMFYGSSWNTTLGNLASNLTDGTVSIELVVFDRVGNQRSLTGFSWTLNTTQPLVEVHLTGNQVGSYIGEGNISFTLSPTGVDPVVQYKLESNTNWSFLQGTTNTTTTLPVNNLTEGRVWLNTTITDAFSRVQHQSFVFDIDHSVNTTPVLALQGTHTQQNGVVILGLDGGYTIQAASDDAWGVGHQHVSCSWNGGAWFTGSNLNVLSPPVLSNAVTGYALRCRNVDLLGNQGPMAWWNGTVDVQAPQVTLATLVGTPLSNSTQLNMSCSDTSGCELISIGALHASGTQQTNHSLQLSSNTTSIVLSQLLSVTAQGTVQFTIHAKDGLNNTHAITTPTYLYLHQTPTVSIHVLSPIHGPYISENLTLSLAPASGWNSDLQLNMSVEYATNGTTIREANIVSANSTQAFSSLQEGNIWVNTSLCNSIGNCSTSATLLTVDASAPLTPGLALSSGAVLSNGSLVGGSSSLFNITNGVEWGSGVRTTNCSTTDGWKETSISGEMYAIGTLLSANQWTTVSCASVDHVGNIGPSRSYVVYRDDVRPEINSTELPVDRVVTPGFLLNITCEDVFSVSMRASFSSQGQIIAQFNASSAYSVLAEDLFGTTPIGSVQYTLSCEDLSGNRNTTSYNFEWLPYLSPSTLIVPSIDVGNLSYVSNSTVISSQNARSDVAHHLRVVTSTGKGPWVSCATVRTLSELNFTVTDQSTLRLQLRVSRAGSELSNLTTSEWLVVDNLGPELALPSYAWYGNSTSIPVGVNDTGTGFHTIVWSFDNGTNQTSTNLGDVFLPDGTEASVWLTATAFDRIGNPGQTQSMQLHRDFDAPTYLLSQSNPGYIGLNTSYSIVINTSTGLKSSEILLQGPNNQTHVLANNITNFSFSSSDVPALLLLNSQLSLMIKATEHSQLSMTAEIVLNVDTVQPTIEIDSSNSVFLSGLNTSNASLIEFDLPIDTQAFCYRIGSNTSALTSSCQTLPSTELQVVRNAGNYVLYLRAVDQAGNIGERWFNVAHHTQAPQISLNLPAVVRPSQNFTVSSTSSFDPQFELTWNNQSLGHSQGMFLIPNTLGNQTLLVNASDELGLWSLVSFDTLVDGTAPSLSLQGWVYNGTKFGTNTTLLLNASDDESAVKEIILHVTDGNASCSETFYPQSLVYSDTGTLGTLLGDASCVLLSRLGTQLTLNVTAVDAVGNVRTVQHSVDYHGATAPPTFVTQRVHSQSGLHRVGPASTVDCLASSGSIAPSLSLTWSGTGGIIQSSQLSAPSSGGVLTCTQSDAFGNSAQSTINLTYDLVAPVINVTWPSGSHQPYVLASGPTFSIDSSDVQAPIHSLQYCIASTPCTPNINTSGTTQFTSSVGGQYLVVSTENLVGLVSNQTIFFIMDNQPPSLNVSSGNHAIMNGTTVYTGLQNSSVLIEGGDGECFASGRVHYDAGSIAVENWTRKSVLVPVNSTFIRVVIEDCVGHTTGANFTVQRLTSITAQSASVMAVHSDASFLMGSVLSIRNTSALSISVPHDVEVEIQCDAPSMTVSCGPTGGWNEFIVNVSTTTSGYLNVTFVDALGNLLLQTYTVDHDATAPQCFIHAAAYMNGSDLVVSSTLSSQYVCTDNKNSLQEVFWLHQGTQHVWSESNGVWFAPIPPSSTVDLVAVDRLGNTRTTTFSVVFDDGPPSIEFTNLSFLSLDEERAKRQGRFDVHCLDAVGAHCTLHVRQTTFSGALLWEENFTHSGQISLQPDGASQEIRIWVLAQDRIGHQRTIVYNLILDDVKPVLDLSWKNSNTGVVLSPEPYIPADGVLEVAGLSSSGVNASTSTLTLECLDTQHVISSALLTSSLDLASLDLFGCEGISVTVLARDHAGNLASYVEVLTVDHMSPRGAMGFEEGCAWRNQNKADVTPDCEVHIAIVDDEHPVLRGQYTITMLDEAGGELEMDQNSVSINTTLPLHRYVGQSITILLTGTDEVGNPIQWEAMQLHVRKDIVPLWTGLKCLESIACDFGMNMTATSVGDEIGLVVQAHHAPLVNVSWTFVNGDGEAVEHFTPMIDSDDVPDGQWQIDVSIMDAAGRNASFTIHRFIYDTTAPVLEIGVSTVGYFDQNQSILGCNTCRLSYRFGDLTSLEFTSNVQEDFVTQDGLFNTIDLRGFFQASINVSATDAFQRQTWLNVSVLPLETTNVDPEQYFSDANVNVFCKEDAPTATHRELVCLWRRTALGAVRVPLAFEVTLDTNHSRASQLALTMDGIDTATLPLLHGSMVHYVDAYTNFVQVEVVDNYSNVKPLNITVLEHDVPWSTIEFVSSDVSETDETTDIILQISPPPGHGEFHLLESTENTGISFNCGVEYVFVALERQKPVRSTSDACTVAEVFVKGNKDIELTLSIDHRGVRTTAGLYNHTYDLINLESLSLLLEYSDGLGMEEVLNRNDMQIQQDQIDRARDSLPSYEGGCLLDHDGTTRSPDGFLQSDVTMPLYRCASALSDEDGIHSTVWNMTFYNNRGGEVYSIDLQCSGTFFPVEWSFGDSFDSGQCTDPGVPFPSGTFDVRIRPFVRDYTMFNEDGDIDERAYPLVGNETQCNGSSGACFVEVFVSSVTVYPSFDPAIEVRNAQEFIDSYSQNLGPGIVLVNASILGVLFYFWRRSRPKLD